MKTYVISTVITDSSPEYKVIHAPVLGVHSNKSKAMDHFLSVRKSREDFPQNTIKDQQPDPPFHRVKILASFTNKTPQYTERVQLEQWTDVSTFQKEKSTQK